MRSDIRFAQTAGDTTAKRRAYLLLLAVRRCNNTILISAGVWVLQTGHLPTRDEMLQNILPAFRAPRCAQPPLWFCADWPAIRAQLITKDAGGSRQRRSLTNTARGSAVRIVPECSNVVHISRGQAWYPVGARTVSTSQSCQPRAAVASVSASCVPSFAGVSLRSCWWRTTAPRMRAGSRTCRGRFRRKTTSHSAASPCPLWSTPVSAPWRSASSVPVQGLARLHGIR